MNIEQEKKQENDSIEQILRDILFKDKNLLASRDELYNQLKEQVPGRYAKDLFTVRKALQYNVGEIFLAADNENIDESKEKAKQKVKEILQKNNMQEKSIEKVISIFVDALAWNKKKENNIEKEIETKVDVEKSNKKDISEIAKLDTWICPKCGNENTQKFCINCGEKRQLNKENIWICPECGKENTNKFCSNCGVSKDGQKASLFNFREESSEPIEKQQDIENVPLEFEKEEKVQQNIYKLNDNDDEKIKEQIQESERVVTSTEPKKTSKKKLRTKIIIFILIIIIVILGIKAMSKNHSSTESKPEVTSSDTISKSSNKTSEESSTIKSDLSLKGLDLGDSISTMKKVLGTNYTTKNKGIYIIYKYSDIEVTAKDDKIVALVSEDSSAKTKGGIHPGSGYRSMIDKYGKPNYEMNDGNLTLYEYEFNSIDNEKGLLRFAVDKATNNIEYISVRIDTKESNKDYVANEAVQTLDSYYAAISKHDMRTAYEYFSEDMKKHMGDLDVYASGYQTTISDKISNVKVTSNSGDEIAVAYILTSRDTYQSGVKVQIFNCTALLSKKTGNWHIVNMSAKKQSEHMEK